eukprot:scaffold133259_cov24-Tisochrysis_lutea.AAC.1
MPARRPRQQSRSSNHLIALGSYSTGRIGSSNLICKGLYLLGPGGVFHSLWCGKHARDLGDDSRLPAVKARCQENCGTRLVFSCAVPIRLRGCLAQAHQQHQDQRKEARAALAACCTSTMRCHASALTPGAQSSDGATCAHVRACVR